MGVDVYYQQRKNIIKKLAEKDIVLCLYGLKMVGLDLLFSESPASKLFHFCSSAFATYVGANQSHLPVLLVGRQVSPQCNLILVDSTLACMEAVV